MKINELKINAYGNLINREFTFKDGINLIYGKNEAGKSTLINFIINSFYGISKNKRGKEISNYDKYRPWNGDEFSGKIQYKLDNGNKYEIYRDFNKKNPKIFNENMEDISKDFNIDKNKGNEFFYEQTKIDEDLFLSTLAINQKEVKLEKQSQNILIQKIANLVGTGDDNISFRIAMDRINRRQLDEIGTDRSREKPINIINKNIEELQNKKTDLEKYIDLKYEIEEEENKLNKIINQLENKNNLLLDIKLLKENQKIEEEKINIKEKIKIENSKKIDLLKNDLQEIESKKLSNNELEHEVQKKEKNKKLNKINILLIILFLINIIQFILLNNNIIKYLFLLTVPIALAWYIMLVKKEKNKIEKYEKIQKNNKEKIELEKNNIQSEKMILETNEEKMQIEINDLKNKFNLKVGLEKEKIKNKYFGKIEEEQINEFILLNNLEQINFEIQINQKELNNYKLKLHSLDLDKKNIEPQIDNLSKIEEELIINKNKKIELEKLNLSINLAKQILSNAYDEMKSNVTPKFTENLSKNIYNITKGKYNKVRFNESTGLVIELENGDYVEAEKLSIGTIEQLYLSLRLSMVNEFSEEIVPILLDEVFAFYDEERLENILKFLSNEYKNRQIVIFTCTKREKHILNKNNIKYNYINI